MRLADVNLLVYATDRSSPMNAAAAAWLETRLAGTESFALAWATVTGFVRVATRHSIFESPLSAAQAFDLVDGWLRRPQVVIVEPTERHVAIMRRLLEPLGTASNLVTDAHLAALAIEQGAILESSDHDFGRFAGLRWEDPLMGPSGRRSSRPARDHV